MRIALLADIHGNIAALSRVVQELERLQPDYVVVDGDLINGIPFSGEVVDLIRAQRWVVVRGNHEYYYLDFGTPRAAEGSDDVLRWGALHWLVERLTPRQGEYLGLLPDERTLFLPGYQSIGVAHGVPGQNRVGFFNEQAAAAIAAHLRAVSAPTFVSAHTHVQVDRHVSLVEEATPRDDLNGQGPITERQWHVINPGSVGLPLNGDPRAQFAMIEATSPEEIAGGWRASMVRVDYDRRAMLAAFDSSGMSEMGGVITRLYYWELVTAETEIIYCYRWARENGFDFDRDMWATFDAYCRATGRDEYVRGRDPLFRKAIP